MIVTDMDGTLLDAEHHLPQGFSQTVRDLKARGIRWVIASGRQLANLKALFDAEGVALDIIAENGALAQLAEADAPFFTDLSSVRAYEAALTCALEIPGATAVLCGAERAWVHDALPQNFKNVSIYFNSTAFWHDYAEIATQSVCKIAIYHPDAANALYPKLAPFASDTLNVFLSGPNWIDVQMAHIDKGNALKALLQHFNYAPQEAIVFGDYLNDIGMLSVGAHAVAMANAHPDLKRLTSHHALPNTQNGVMNYLHRLAILP